MSNQHEHPLTSNALKALAQQAKTPCQCALKICKGWESVGDDRWPAAQMVKAGMLRPELPEGQFELSFEEFHPEGTRYDSPDAPIAIDYFPYNRCDVNACSKCQQHVLRYTEFGGYYVDHRARRLNAELITD